MHIIHIREKRNKRGYLPRTKTTYKINNGEIIMEIDKGTKNQKTRTNSLERKNPIERTSEPNLSQEKDLVDSQEKKSDLDVTKLDDTLNGSQKIDVFHGNDGNDLLTGEAGNDRLYGDSGKDSLNGGEGDDYLNGGSHSDTLTGGAGKDFFFFVNPSEAIDTIADFGEGDRIAISQINFKATSTDQFSYNDKTGALYFDASATDTTQPTQFALLPANLGDTFNPSEDIFFPDINIKDLVKQNRGFDHHESSSVNTF
jgi:Ca2+-binding RTX toxin-like protein